MIQEKHNVITVKRNRVLEEQGVALFAALAFLLIFSMLGTAYMRSMQISYKITSENLQKVRARHLSHGGIYAGIGEVQASLGRGDTPVSSYEINLPVYRTVEGEELESPQTILVNVSDESGKVNLNSAPSTLLVALGIPAKVVSKIKGSPLRGTRKALTSVDELRTGDFMTGQNYNALDKRLFTVYTGGAESSVAPTNLNSASAKVLSGIFSIDLEEATSLAHKRPFLSWEDVLGKVGREPSTFNVGGVASNGQGIPASLSLDSRTFRINSTTHMVTRDTTSNGVYRSVDAVVLFANDGSFSVRYWDESPSGEPESEIAVTVADVSEATETSVESE
jgi:type II secretory pathway component PulK